MAGIAQADGLPMSFPSLAASLPTSDRTSLIGLSDDDVRAWSVAKADEYRRFALTVLSIYNAVAPIHRLPSEILSKIFEECWTSPQSLRIGHVCRWWRSVLLDTKRFWASAVNSEGYFPNYCSFARRLDRLEAMLERSAPLPLDPSFYPFSSSVSLRLACHSQRLRSLEVYSPTEGAIFTLWGFLNSGMSCLTTLAINLGDKDFPEWIPSICAPLKDLSLSQTALPLLSRVSAPVGLLPSLALPSLQHVTLTNPFERDGPNGRLESDCFWEALQVCAQNLRTLVLLGATPWLYTNTTPHSFPALGHLRIEDTTRRCSLILPRLALPTTTHIHCTNIDGGTLCNTILTLPTPNSAQSTIGATDRVAIIETAEASSVHCYVGDEELLRLDVGSVGLLHPDLVQVFRDRARVTQLAADNHGSNRGFAWRAFPHLVRAEVRGKRAKHTVTSLAPSGGDTEVLCPDLGILAIDFPCRIQQRIGVGDSGELGDTLGTVHVDIAVRVESYLGKRCAELAHVLSLRSQMGTRLRRLEFGCTLRSESAGLNFEGVLDPSDPDWVSWRPIVEPLKRLVDGPVVFTGYRFFPADGQ